MEVGGFVLLSVVPHTYKIWNDRARCGNKIWNIWMYMDYEELATMYLGR